jgi:type I protein arginine methyltransferase
MFCAKAGAKQVIAVDNSDILDKARENVYTNGLGETIVCLKGKIEEVVLPVDKVDIIVSEWMGYCLLYEAMLPSVIWARDRYLQPDGLLVPSHASMWIAPVSDAEYVSEHISFWRDVYGFDMKPMQENIYQDARIQTMPPASLCGTPFAFRLLDLHTTKVEDLVFDAPWESKLTQKIDELHGFLVWFDIFFARTRDDPSVVVDVTAKDWSAGHPEDRVYFTTGPHGTETHWRQGLLLSKGQKEDMDREENGVIRGEITYAVPDGKARGLNLSVNWGSEGKGKQSQTWLLH